MNVKRYFAPTAREALRRVKEELGPDAVVLSNRSLDGGVEILALPPEAMSAVHAALNPQPTAQSAAVAQRSAQAVGSDDVRVTLSAPAEHHAVRPLARSFAPWLPKRADARSETAARAAPTATAPISAAAQPPAALPRTAATDAVPAKVAGPRQEATPARADSDGIAAKLSAELANERERMTRELESIRGLLENQLAGFAWGELARTQPARTRMLAELLHAGFSAQLARELAVAADGVGDMAQARPLVREALGCRLHTLASDADIIDRGGVYALVGPTGVGKTTTTAKLAARCVVRHGADKLALVTTDGYRIGAHEQLRIYGRILGVTVHVVRDAADLRSTLADLRNKHMVLIDTVGMSQRDRAVTEQAAMLLAAGDVRRLLLLNGTARGDTLDDVVRAYDGPDLAGCIFTKVDEAASLAPAIDCAVRHNLEVFYVSNGQRVPEDLHLPNRPYLLHRALKELPESSPHRLQSEEAGLLMADRPRGGVGYPAAAA